MKKYVKPIVIANEELAEGVYAGSGCMSASVSPVGADSERVRFQVDYEHHATADHCNTNSVVVIKFSVPVQNYVGETTSTVSILSGDGTDTIAYAVNNDLHAYGNCKSNFNIVAKPLVPGEVVTASVVSISDEGYQVHDGHTHN